jgi:flavin-dependent dehydrogenase
MYHAIVVGARCAGSPTAMLLARKGYRVLLVDKATFPSDAPRCHFIQLSGVTRLQRWGLLDQLAASNCPPISSMCFNVGTLAFTDSLPPVEGVAGSYAPRRTVLDKLLVDAAARAGAEVRESFAVQELLMEGDRVTGIRGRGADGATVTERADIVIGADGLHSLVARSAQAPAYHVKPSLTCGYFGYWSGVPMKSMELYAGEQQTMFVFPTNDNLTCIGIEWPIQRFPAVRADVEGHFRQAIEQAPRLAERVRSGRREERFMGAAELPNFFRKPYGPGWALVGDAGAHKDPYMALGISDAFRDAELLAEAIDAGLAGRQRLEDALAAYERQRNDESLPTYELNWQLARMGPPREVLRLMGIPAEKLVEATTASR